MLNTLKTNRLQIIKHFHDRGSDPSDAVTPVHHLQAALFINILNTLEVYLLHADPDKRRVQLQASLALYEAYAIFDVAQLLHVSRNWLAEYFRDLDPEPGHESGISRKLDQAYDDFLTDLVLYRKRLAGNNSGRLKRSSRLNLHFRAFQQSSDAILIADAEGRVQDVNQAFLGLYGYSRREVIGRTPGFLRSSRTTDQFYREMWRSISEHGEWKGEIWNRCKSGEEKCVWLSITAISEGDTVIGYLGVQIDQSLRKEMEMLLLQSERMAMVGQMSAKVAHEIRNPLSSIMLNCELLWDELEAIDVSRTDEAGCLLEAITSETERMEKLLNEYLHFSRLPKSEPEICDLTEVVNDELNFLAAEAARKKVIVRRVLPEKGAFCQIDPQQICRIIINLCENAMDAMPDGGELTASVEVGDGVVVLKVADTGTGIAPQDREKVFDPFYTKKRDGTGLGLSLVQQIVHENNGRIILNSRVNHGTAFEIHFPAHTGH